MNDAPAIITTQLQGGLGNQMFQIAAAYAFGLRHGHTVSFNFTNHYLPLQGRKAKNYQDNIFRKVCVDNKLCINNVYTEHGHSYLPIPYCADSVCLHGYFQSEKYFNDFSQQIKDLFNMTDDIKSYIESKYSSFLGQKTTSIHIRRGDYLKFSNVHPPCGKEYYHKAMQLLGDTDLFVIFSDDPEWCRKNFIGEKFLVIGGEEDYVDMYLMSKCNNNIIANSSFSWWGAWLNNNENKRVIAPMKWFGDDGPQDYHDVAPDSWEKI